MKPILTFLLIVLLSSFQLFFGQEQSGCGTNPFQDWYRVHDNEAFVTITGTISRTIHHNSGDFYDDGDWNIYVTPDDTRFLINRNGDRNENNEIEFEVQTRGKPTNLATLFPVGTRIEAYGEWVEDSGHGDKTELHPVYYIRTLNSNPTRVFLGQDDSGRFVDAQNVFWESFAVPLPKFMSLVTPNSTPPPSRTNIVEESFTIARGTSRPGISPTSYFSNVYLDSWWFSDCEYFLGRVIYGDSPYFISEIETSTGSLLTDNVTYSVSTEISSGIKIANLKVTAEISPPPNVTFSEAEWTYESSSGVTGTIVETQNSPPFKLEFIMPYCPALGYEQNAWSVTVEASSVSSGVHQPVASEEFENTFERTLVTESRTYMIPKSEISLNIEKKGDICGDVAYCRIDKSDILPDIKLREVRWYVSILKDSDGFIISSPQEVQVTPQNSIDDVGLQAMTYNATTSQQDLDERFDIIWKDLSSGEPNLSLIKVIARGVTEIGENIQTQAILSPNCGLGTFSYTQIYDAFYKLKKKRGYDMEFYKSRIKRKDKIWIQAFAKYFEGKKLNRSDKDLIQELVNKSNDIESTPDTSIKPIRRIR